MTAILLCLTSCTLDDEQIAGPRWSQVLERRAELAGFEQIPDEQPRRLISSAERLDVLRSCLDTQGHAVTEPDFGEGIAIEGVAEEESRQAEYLCLARFPYRRDLADVDLTDEQLTVHYKWMASAIIPCIDALELETASLPDLGKFIETYRNDQPLWFPGEYSPTELDRINESCELLPPMEEVYPDGPS